jgi:hypothetical protein
VFQKKITVEDKQWHAPSKRCVRPSQTTLFGCCVIKLFVCDMQKIQRTDICGGGGGVG